MKQAFADYLSAEACLFLMSQLLLLGPLELAAIKSLILGLW
jgi:hypothetical protein